MFLSGEILDGKVMIDGEVIGETEGGRLEESFSCTGDTQLEFVVEKGALSKSAKITVLCEKLKASKNNILVAQDTSQFQILERASPFFPVETRDVSKYKDPTICKNGETGCYFDYIYEDLKGSKDVKELFFRSVSSGIDSYLLIEGSDQLVLACGLKGEAKDIEDHVVQIGISKYLEKGGEKCFWFSFSGKDPDIKSTYFIDKEGRIALGSFP
jgi:hypothetical protein